VIGKRFPDGELIPEPGGYSKHIVIVGETEYVAWMLMAPKLETNNGFFLIGYPHPDRPADPYHWVRENADGTITVEPEPADAPPERRNSNSILAPNGWHGYIYAGEWRHC
jgi:hypothetical protein